MQPSPPRARIAVPPFAVPPAPPAPPGARGAEEVVREAEAHPPGVELLLSASLEAAAIAFGVHPDVVAEARAILARRGVER